MTLEGVQRRWPEEGRRRMGSPKMVGGTWRKVEGAHKWQEEVKMVGEKGFGLEFSHERGKRDGRDRELGFFWV